MEREPIDDLKLFGLIILGLFAAWYLSGGYDRYLAEKARREQAPPTTVQQQAGSNSNRTIQSNPSTPTNAQPQQGPLIESKTYIVK